MYKGLVVEFSKVITNKTLSLFVMMPLVIAVVIPYALTTEKGVLGMLAFFNVFMISIMETLISVVEEKEHRTLEAMMVTPLGLKTVLLSKVLISVLLVSINAVVIMVAVPWVFSIAVETASVILIVLLSAAFSFLYAGLALIMAAFMNNMKEAEQTGTAVATLLLFFGFIPLDRMPSWLQEVVKVIPLTNGNYLFTSIVLDSVQGLEQVLFHVIGSLVVCAVFVYLGFRIFTHKYT